MECANVKITSTSAQYISHTLIKANLKPNCKRFEWIHEAPSFEYGNEHSGFLNFLAVS
jgi:hypothetical protein